jgi:hypothetical protein
MDKTADSITAKMGSVDKKQKNGLGKICRDR